ncbi:MAG TPA: N-acetylmuramoyl-L-alanine amidase [Solirubrobacteraceae bacterium]|nr:N-acetylmuramoyl-L-alanine amidase [Solirubrobacteraceae bacterium]
MFESDMGVPGMTRRSLLRAGAGALAGAALRPAVTLAAHGSDGRLAAIDLGLLHGTRTIELPPRVAVAGLQWRGSTGAQTQLRAQLGSGEWGPWVSAGEHGHGPDAPGRPWCTGEPLWIGGARRVQVRSALLLAGARLRLVLATAGGLEPDTAGAAALTRAQPVLAAGAGQPPIIARSVWAVGIPPPRVAPAYGAVELAFVHHTENPNGYSAGEVPAMLRAIFLFHREVNGWNDIGYNFVIDRFGRVWEARAGGIDEPVAGAQAGGYNFVSTGVAVLGSFSGTRISDAARGTLQRLLAWKLALHGTPSAGRVTVRVNPAGASYSKYPANARVSLRRVSGHRDADSTECPGDALYGELPGIRRRVSRLAGQPVVARIALVPAPPAAPATPEAAPVAQPPQLLVALARLGGAPLPGLPVQLQARTVARKGLLVTHTPVGEGVTDASGRCVLPASFAVGASGPHWVRALYAGAQGGGAAVSPAVEVAAVPAPGPVPPSAPAPGPTA